VPDHLPGLSALSATRNSAGSGHSQR